MSARGVSPNVSTAEYWCSGWRLDRHRRECSRAGAYGRPGLEFPFPTFGRLSWPGLAPRGRYQQPPDRLDCLGRYEECSSGIRVSQQRWKIPSCIATATRREQRRQCGGATSRLQWLADRQRHWSGVPTSGGARSVVQAGWPRLPVMFLRLRGRLLFEPQGSATCPLACGHPWLETGVDPVRWCARSRLGRAARIMAQCITSGCFGSACIR
jgi:hypothetical protein